MMVCLSVYTARKLLSNIQHTEAPSFFAVYPHPHLLDGVSSEHTHTHTRAHTHTHTTRHVRACMRACVRACVRAWCVRAADTCEAYTAVRVTPQAKAVRGEGWRGAGSQQSAVV